MSWWRAGWWITPPVKTGVIATRAQPQSERAGQGGGRQHAVLARGDAHTCYTGGAHGRGEWGLPSRLAPLVTAICARCELGRTATSTGSEPPLSGRNLRDRLKPGLRVLLPCLYGCSPLFVVSSIQHGAVIKLAGQASVDPSDVVRSAAAHCLLRPPSSPVRTVHKWRLRARRVG